MARPIFSEYSWFVDYNFCLTIQTCFTQSHSSTHTIMATAAVVVLTNHWHQLVVQCLGLTTLWHMNRAGSICQPWIEGSPLCQVSHSSQVCYHDQKCLKTTSNSTTLCWCNLSKKLSLELTQVKHGPCICVLWFCSLAYKTVAMAVLFLSKYLIES